MQTFASARVSGLTPSEIAPANSTTMTIFPSLLPPTFQGVSVVPASVIVPGGGVYEGRPFRVIAAGNVVSHGSSQTLNFGLYNGTSLTASSDGTALLTLGSVLDLYTPATYPFALSALLQGDSASGILQVVDAEFVCGNSAGTVTKTGIASGLNLISPTNGAALNLVFGLKFGVADADSAANLMSFYAEA